MSRIEKIPLKCESLSMSVRGSSNIPEVAVPPAPSPLPPSSASKPSLPNTSGEVVPESLPFSPTNSVDSGRSTGAALWPSSKYFVFGGPGFSIGILDTSNESLQRLPVPVPTLNMIEAADATNFSKFEVTCLALAGECQVWAGTEVGSLHVFDLEPGPRLGSHGYSKLSAPMLCLRAESLVPGNSRAMSLPGNRGKHSSMRTEVLVGSTNNTLTVISGEANARGSLLNVAKCNRKVIQLGDSHVTDQQSDEDLGTGVNCICLVGGGPVEEMYWCGCGPCIVILRRNNWKVFRELDQSDELDPNQHVSMLECSEHGVWSSAHRSSAMLLWDTKTFTLKMKIPCFKAGVEAPLENKNAQVTCLVYSEPLLLVGTRGGYLLIFYIHRPHQRYRTRHSSMADTALHCLSSSHNHSSSPDLAVQSLPASPKLALRAAQQKGGRTLEYTMVCSTHCTPRPIVSLHPVTVQSGICASPYLSSPSHTLNVLVLFGGSDSDESARGLVHSYEVTSSPLGSPMTSPQTMATGGRKSTTSLPPGGLRNSLHDLEEMPKLTLHRVSKGALSYLPLQENTAW